MLNRRGLRQAIDGNPALITGVPEALAKLSNAGFILVVASNEPEISQGQLDLDELEAAHNKLSEMVENRGGAIAAFFYCPHAPQDHCHCRKPNTGLIDAIELEFATPANEMIFIGTEQADVQLADAVGAQALWVSGSNAPLSQTDTVADDHCFAELNQACDFILRHF